MVAASGPSWVTYRGWTSTQTSPMGRCGVPSRSAANMKPNGWGGSPWVPDASTIRAGRGRRVPADAAPATASGPATASPGEMTDALYAGKKASLRPLHDQLMAMVHAMGPDVSLAPKKGYVSLRRPRKQFAMIQPSGAGRIDLGLILPGVPAAGRLEPSGSFNALFTHRVRVTSADDLDDALAGWLAAAYAAAG